jgi:hypothetical protein
MATMKTYTTDKAIYTIEQYTQRRVEEFVGNAPVWGETTVYRIMKDGKLVSVAYNENDIAYVIDCQENPARYAGMN